MLGQHEFVARWRSQWKELVAIASMVAKAARTVSNKSLLGNDEEVVSWRDSKGERHHQS
jgi:hypothetical protein